MKHSFKKKTEMESVQRQHPQRPLFYCQLVRVHMFVEVEMEVGGST